MEYIIKSDDCVSVPEKYVKLVQDMYTGCRTKVRTVAGESSKFNVEVGLHQGSALSPYLFLILMDVLTERVRKEAPESMLFADESCCAETMMWT